MVVYISIYIYICKEGSGAGYNAGCIITSTSAARQLPPAAIGKIGHATCPDMHIIYIYRYIYIYICYI